MQKYQLSNNIESATLELDENANIISYEEYYPYGDTSYQAGRSAAEVSQKRYRYTGKEKDEESGLYYHGARYYACWLGRWTAADPAGLVDGVNLYVYCRGNPMRFIDPSGLVDVDILEYAKTYGEANVISTENNDNTRIKVTLGDKFFYINEGEYSSKDGRLICDDSKFVEAFGVGTDGIIVYEDATTKNVSIRAAFNISGEAAEKTIDGTTYRALFLKGIEEKWTHDFEDKDRNKTYGVAAYAKENPEGIKATIVDKAGTSQVRYPGFFSSGKNWSPSNPGSTKIYTHFSNNQEGREGELRTSDEYKWTVAHEFGHLLGLSSKKNKGNFGKGIMGGYYEPPSEKIIKLVLDAHKNKKIHYAPYP